MLLIKSHTCSQLVTKLGVIGLMSVAITSYLGILGGYTCISLCRRRLSARPWHRPH